MENDEHTSHVLPLACPELNPDRQGVLHAWLVVNIPTGSDVGMAIVSPPSADSCGRAELNTYVHPDHRGQGLGTRLLNAALAVDPTVAGFYSESSIGLYRAHRLASAWPAPRHADRTLITPPELPGHLGPDNLTDNQRLAVDLVEKDRDEYRAHLAALSRKKISP